MGLDEKEVSLYGKFLKIVFWSIFVVCVIIAFFRAEEEFSKNQNATAMSRLDFKYSIDKDALKIIRDNCNMNNNNFCDKNFRESMKNLELKYLVDKEAIEEKRRLDKKAIEDKQLQRLLK